MLKKVLVATSLLSVSAASVSAYAADGLADRGSSAVSKANSAGKKGLIWVAIAGAVGGGIWLATDSNGGDNDESPE
jgi:hypothetical protein